MHRWLQVAPVELFPFKIMFLVWRRVEHVAINPWATQQPGGSHSDSFTSPTPLWVPHFTLQVFSQTVPSSHVWSRLCLLRHSSPLSGQESQRGGVGLGVMSRQGTCYVNLGGKALHIWKNALLYPLWNHFFSFLWILKTNRGNFKFYLDLNIF